MIRIVKVLILATTLGTVVSTVAQENCRPIETTDSRKGYPIIAQSITRPGEYCLRHDIRAPRVYVLSEGGERSFPNFMLTIDASNVDLDLHGFSMSVDTRGMRGIRLGYEKPDARHIVIRNGALKIRLGTAIAFNIPEGSIYSDFKAIYNQSERLAKFYKSQFGINDIAAERLQEALRKLPKNVDGYPQTVHLAENLKVKSQGIGIGMQGAANTIRNSTIEVTDGHAAIYLFGPNQIIENNIIIFKGKAAVESAAAIKLHQADGTIIRNNDIIIENSGEDAPKAAISLIDSKNVVAENNRIYGINKQVHAWDDKSNLIDRDNDFRFILRRPWPSDKPGVQ